MNTGRPVRLVFALVAFLLVAPRAAGAVAGVPVDEPPRTLLGRFLDAGRSDALIAWLNQKAAQPQTGEFVVSTDMLGYGGLTASRIPGGNSLDMRNKSLAKLSARLASADGNSMANASLAEMCALNNNTLPSLLASCCTDLAAGKGSPSVAMPSVMLMTNGG